MRTSPLFLLGLALAACGPGLGRGSGPSLTPPPAAAKAEPAAEPTGPKPAPEPAPAAEVDGPVLAAIDVFGSRKVPRAEIVKALGLEVGAPVDVGSPAFHERLAAAEARLQARHAFAFVKISPISYFAGPDAGKVYITVDIVDAGDERRMQFAPEPRGNLEDPDGLIEGWIEYEAKAWELLRAGELDPNAPGACKGGVHCALGFSHPDLQAYEQIFIDNVPRNAKALRRVLEKDRDARKRAAAAFLLAYAPTPRAAVDNLVVGIGDPSPLVRNNVLRVILMAQEKAERPIVPIEPLLHALDFPETTDRNKAGYALYNLLKKSVGTDRYEPYKRRVLEAAGEILLAMIDLEQPNNRDPALQILELLSGQDHGRDAAAWRAWLESALAPPGEEAPGDEAPPAARPIP